MLKVENIADSTLNIVAPTVYIDSIEIENNSVRVDYHLEDPSNEWSTNKFVLDDVFLNIGLADQLYQESLSSVLKKTNNIGANFFGFTTFDINNIQNFNALAIQSPANNVVSSAETGSYETSAIYLTTACGNSFFSGTIDKELVLASGSIPKSTYATQSYNYINKIKNIDALNISLTASLPNNTGSSETLPAIQDDLFVSYRPEKKANIGFLFDLEIFLENNSRTYQILKKYNEFKDIILKNSYIVVDASASLATQFFKNNKTLLEENYKKIESQVFAYKLDDDKNVYYVCTTDDNTDKLNTNEFAVEANIVVYDYSYELFNSQILNKLDRAYNNLLFYNNLFKRVLSNKLIKNKNKYVFENNFQELSPLIKEIIDNVSPIYAFYTNKTKEEYVSIMLSLLHPLTTSTNILEKLATKLSDLQRATEKIVQDISRLNVPSEITPRTNFLYLQDTYRFNNRFNYNYKLQYGYQVITSDSLTTLESEPLSGIKILSSAQKEARRILEIKKYLSNASQTTASNLEFFTISQLQLGPTAYGFTAVTPPSPSSTNEAFIKLNEYINHNFDYRRTESTYFQLADEGICVDTIANATNNSVNNLQKSVIFDPNLDSQQQSLQFLTSTGVETLFYKTNEFLKFDNILSEIPRETYQYEASQRSSGLQVSTVPLNTGSIKNVDALTRILFYYKDIFKDTLKYSTGDNANYDLYRLEPYYVSPIFSDKIRHFNELYLVEYKLPAESTQSIAEVDYGTELNFNIEPKYLNRITTQAQIILSTNIL